MAPGRTVIGRDTNQAMHARFCFHPAICIHPANPQGCRFDTRFLAITFLDGLQLEAARLSPSGIHPQQHRRPILCLCAAGARVNFNKAIIAISLAGKKRFKLFLARNLGKLLQGFHSFCNHFSIIFFFGQLHQLGMF